MQFVKSQSPVRKTQFECENSRLWEYADCVSLSWEVIENYGKIFSCTALVSSSTNGSAMKCCWRNLTMIIPSMLCHQQSDFFDFTATSSTAMNDRMMKTQNLQCYSAVSTLLCWMKVCLNLPSVTETVCTVQCHWLFTVPEKIICTSNCCDSIRTHWQPGGVWRDLSASAGNCSTLRSIACDCLLLETSVCSA